MAGLKIGLVDLDTSHPANWLPILRSLGHEVIGVYDGGTVYPQGYAEKFAAEHGVEQVFSSTEEMAEHVDLAIIHSCNWELHVPRSLPFIRHQKALLIDKPIAGSLKDLLQMQEWRNQGIRIAGGSSIHYAEEVRNWLSVNNSKDVLFAQTGCSTDEFNYGIHAYSLLHAIMGSGIESVKYLTSRVQHFMEISWSDGRKGLVGVGETKSYLPFYANIITESNVSHFQVDSKKVYRSLLEKVLPYLAGETEEPVPFNNLIEVELAAIAARISRQSDGKRIFLKDIPYQDPGYDGSGFAAFYQRQKMKIK